MDFRSSTNYSHAKLPEVNVHEAQSYTAYGYWLDIQHIGDAGLEECVDWFGTCQVWITHGQVNGAVW